MVVQRDDVDRDDPKEIAAFLVAEHDLVRAREMAQEGIISANGDGDFYSLSVWREVKNILRDWKEDTETASAGNSEIVRKNTLFWRINSLFHPRNSL